MRLRKTLARSCIFLMAALLIVPVALADQGVSPGWPGIGIMPPYDGSNADMNSLNLASSVTITAAGDVGPATRAPPAPISLPSGDTAIFSAPAICSCGTTQNGIISRGTLPGLPSITLVETPHLVSTGATPGTEIWSGSSVGYVVPPTPPGYWDNIGSMDLHTNMPVLDGSMAFA